jgi:hypothetical protein
MDQWGIKLPKKSAGAGAAIGLAFGAFTAMPWGTFVSPDSPGVWLAAPLVVAFTLIGAWFGTVVSLSDVDSASAKHHVPAEDEHQVFGGHHGQPTPA